MKITLPYRYTAEVIPPRCRNPRRVQFSKTITLNLHEVSAAAAPIAIIEHSHDWDADSNKIPTAMPYRYWRGRLYTRKSFQRVSRGEYETQTAEQFQRDPWPFSLKDENGDRWYLSLAQSRAEFRRWASRILFIDGERWETSGEPRYVVMTFGLGHNHGLGWGTSLSTDNSYNSNIGRNRYFRADQYQAALDEATRIATARGDTKALPIETEQSPTRFEILIPEAIKLNPAREHGAGNAFTNGIETLIESSPNAMIAGFGVMTIAAGLFSDLSDKEKGRSAATHRLARHI